MKGIIIRNLTPADWPSVRDIYEQGISTGDATFETQAPEWPRWNDKMLDCCRLAAAQEGRLLGWAALSPYSSRAVYRGVAEVSIYIANQNRGRGVGRFLMEHLVAQSEAHGLWTLQASIFPENKASIRLHQNAGFRSVGLRERIAQQHGVWRDVVLLERRSVVVG